MKKCNECEASNSNDNLECFQCGQTLNHSFTFRSSCLNKVLIALLLLMYIVSFVYLISINARYCLFNYKYYIHFGPSERSIISKGKYRPDIDVFGSVRQKYSIPIIPFVFLFDYPNAEFYPSDLRITLYDVTNSRGYDTIDHITFSKFEIHYDTGEKQIIIPSNIPISYYGGFTKGTESWIPTLGNTNLVKFPVGIYGQTKKSYGWIGLIKMTSKANLRIDFRILLEGHSYNKDSTIESFSYSVRFEKVEAFRFGSILDFAE